jgi:hypothetical protein
MITFTNKQYTPFLRRKKHIVVAVFEIKYGIRLFYKILTLIILIYTVDNIKNTVERVLLQILVSRVQNSITQGRVIVKLSFNGRRNT